MSEQRLYVFIYLPGETVAVPAGVFLYDKNTLIGRFAYGERYLQRQGALPVDPVALPLRPGFFDPVRTNKGLYGAFRDASPDNWGRLLAAAERHCAINSLSESDLLLSGGATRVGNLDFRLHLSDPEPQLTPPRFIDLDELLTTADAVQKADDIAKNLVRQLRAGSAMGGARPKCTVEWEEALWIAKFPASRPAVPESFNNPRVEYATMTLAQRAGITIPDIRLVPVGNRDILLVKRFDRERHGDTYRRKGFISALSLLQMDESDQLQGRIGYPDIADRMRTFGDEHARTDLRELYRRMAFNAACRNVDDHARNHGFLITGHYLTLSPAYDIVPDPAIVGVGSEFQLALQVGKYGRYASRENLLSHCGRFGLTLDEASEILSQVAQQASRWRECFADCGVIDKEAELFRGSFALVETLEDKPTNKRKGPGS